MANLETTYDTEVANRFMETNEHLTGLPGFLGVRFSEFGPVVFAPSSRCAPSC